MAADSWNLFSSYGDYMAARKGHIMCSFTEEAAVKLLVYGGEYDNRMHNDVFVGTLDFSTRSITWSQISVTTSVNNMPKARAYASVFCTDTQMYFFGGMSDSNVLLNDLFYISYDNPNEIVEVATSNAPSERYGASFTPNGTFESAYLFGGRTDAGSLTMNNELYVFDITNRQWGSEIISIGIPPRARYNHSAVIMPSDTYDECLFIIFGSCKSGEQDVEVCTDIYKYIIEIDEWEVENDDLDFAAYYEVSSTISLVPDHTNAYIFGGQTKAVYSFHSGDNRLGTWDPNSDCDCTIPREYAASTSYVGILDDATREHGVLILHGGSDSADSSKPVTSDLLVYRIDDCSAFTGCSNCLDLSSNYDFDSNRPLNDVTIDSCSWCSQSATCASEASSCDAGLFTGDSANCPNCSGHSSCSDCIEDENCGWCASSGECLVGDSVGSYSQNFCISLDAWRFDECSSCDSYENNHDSCISQSNSMCGWCWGNSVRDTDSCHFDSFNQQNREDNSYYLGDTSNNYSSYIPVNIKNNNMCIEGGKNWQTPSEKCSEGWEYENNTNCAQIKNANDCAKENLCGWCASSSVTSKDSNGKCLYGDIFCPYSDQCDGAGWYYDNITKCSQFSSSEGCSNYSSQFHQECDWNENSEKCEDKSSNALLIGVIGVVGVGALAGGGVAV
ncbi:hypothetical protein ADUPG1_009982, partial [Aduncisulcus paluster]